MSAATCFRCQKKFRSEDPDDLAGDGKCSECKKVSAEIGFKVDLKMAEIRRNRAPQQPSLIRQMFSEEEIQGFQVDPQGRIISGRAAKQLNVNDLGISFDGGAPPPSHA